MLFVEYPKCSTCQKAKKWLDENGFSYEDRHIKENNPTYEELKTWYAESGLTLRKFFNTSGMLYKSMNSQRKTSKHERGRTAAAPCHRWNACKASNTC